jgi:hypothetical protein
MNIQEKMKHRTKRLYQRYLLWSRSMFTKSKQDPDEYEQISATICRKLMARPDTKFAIAPLSEKRYIINEPMGMFVVMEPDLRDVQLTNHVYHYSVRMQDKTFRSIAKMFDNKVEGIRVNYEKEIHDQIQHSLVNVLEKLGA